MELAEKNLLFSSRQLRQLLIPLIIERMLASLMGIVDTMMVSNVGAEAVAGVSCVDSINQLVIFLLTAMAAGGTIICAQYLGRRDRENAERAARQVVLAATVTGLALMVLCLALRRPLLRLIFGRVEPGVMAAAETYFLITSLSYPLLALSNAISALYRAAGNSRLPMLVSVGSNLVNIAGNALLMFRFGLGVAGAAAATTFAAALGAAVLVVLQRRPGGALDLGPLFRIRPEWGVIWLVLSIGIPSGLENAMFQLGKLVVQSTVSTLGTTAISANAIVTVLELMTAVPGQAIGIGMVTVVGQCIGAGETEQAKYYIRKLTAWGALVLLVFNWVIYALTGAVTVLAGMDAASAAMAKHTLLWISLVKPFLWPLAFLPVNGMRAAGDVRYALFASAFSMWVFRVGLTTLLCRVLGVGLIGIWCGYFADWGVRSILFPLRYRSGKWLAHHVIE